MRHFVVVYDRTTGDLDIEEYGADERAAALERRFELERLHASDPQKEIVVLSAVSRKAVERTHARYFREAGELARESASAALKTGKDVRRKRVETVA